jgi:hypothetical protein
VISARSGRFRDELAEGAPDRAVHPAEQRRRDGRPQRPVRVEHLVEGRKLLTCQDAVVDDAANPGSDRYTGRAGRADEKMGTMMMVGER